MPLSLNEIKARAAAFALEFENAGSEESEAQQFEMGFFSVFGLNQRKVSTFEKKVKLPDWAPGEYGYIDLFWPGNILVEMKSRGKDMEKAYKQAKLYADSLPNVMLPKLILICDFHTFHCYDLDNDGKKTVFTLEQLADHIELFTFMVGYQKRVYQDQDPVNIQAAELMGKVHDQLKEIGYSGHELEIYLVRLLFSLFADDTSLFEKNTLYYYLKERTAEDGSDLAPKLAELFEVLNTPEKERLKTLDEQLCQFPYIDGKLFEERLRIAAFDSKMRNALLVCCQFDWSKISPAIFGAMFQSVMNPELRRNLGAHYTSEQNILKVVHPLFLDGLWDEFEHITTLRAGKKQRLEAFHKKIASLKFLDPACGCGNFLVITYRELRLLELALLKELYKNERFLDVSTLCRIDVDQFYGIEIEDFPSQVALVALWLMDHQMNLKVRDAFGQYFARIPLRTSPKILCANALGMNWEDLVPKNELNYILGNPPFGGARLMSERQKSEVFDVFHGVKNNGDLDYVTCWYKMAAEYIQGTDIEVGFVSTNSITQGIQPAILWKELHRLGIMINFAHQTFKWTNEASGKAAVFCVIIGFSLHAHKQKQLFFYETVTGEPHEMEVDQINAYLVDAPDILIESRQKPLCNVPPIGIGNKPIDGGFYLFTDEEKKAFIKVEPMAKKYFHPWYGSDEFINNRPRWCLWLGETAPDKLRAMPEVLKRIDEVKRFRLASKSPGTRKLALTPTHFHVENMPTSNYLLIPRVSSERRLYIPIGFMKPDILSSDAVFIIPNATLFHFGVLTSTMHMAWTRYVCGRLKSDYRYSKDIVYNNFPWPSPTGAQKTAIEEAAQVVLDIRKNDPDSSLADLYDPNTMPKDLLKAHARLDKLVEKAYRKNPFMADSERVSFLFELYQQLEQEFRGNHQ
ncbi:MAG: hypothetical protein PHQ75_02335 [Thermoguttaceae bacterium]|nr:hypothetical protein [Thermoguttaceae bacterium]